MKKEYWFFSKTSEFWLGGTPFSDSEGNSHWMWESPAHNRPFSFTNWLNGIDGKDKEKEQTYNDTNNFLIYRLWMPCVWM